MAALALDVAALAKSVPGGRLLFSGLDLAVAAGEIVAIMGESGAGKSTLLNLVAGLDTADGGRVAVDGVALSGLDDDARTALRRDRIGFVFQAFHILPHLTLAQNIALPLVLGSADSSARGSTGARGDTSPRGSTGARGEPIARADPIASADPIARANAMLAAVGLAGRGADYPAQLSGGELQRIAIGRALVHRPALILADEPTGNLDAETAERILALLVEAVRSSGAGAVIVTHSDRAAAVADRVLVLGASGLGPR